MDVNNKTTLGKVKVVMLKGETGGVSAAEVNSKIAKSENTIQGEIASLKGVVGSPLVANTSAAMTDTNKIYVYTGSESHYTFGDWYYYNGTRWISGGIYNSVAVETDKTLAVENMAADAKAVGTKKADKASTVITGSLSLGRKTDTNVGSNSIALGVNVEASGTAAFAEGQNTVSSANASHAEGYGATASNTAAHAEGRATAAGNSSHAEGKATAIGAYSHAEGDELSVSRGNYSHAENKAQAFADSSHAEGGGQTYEGATYAHAEGLAIASGYAAHAEGDNIYAAGSYSHAENQANAVGNYSHAENQSNSLGAYSHAEGSGQTGEKATMAHAEGRGTIAAARYQHVEGQYNIADSVDDDGIGTYAHIVGNGTDDTRRANAHTLDWSGNAWYKGEVHVGGSDYSGGSKLLTSADVAGKADRTELNVKADKASPVFTGSISLNRKADTTVGNRSSAVGTDNEASATNSHAEGQETVASGANSHAEGFRAQATGAAAHAEGEATASGSRSHAEGKATATGAYSHAENYGSANADYSHAENAAVAGGQYSHAEGTSETTGNALYAHAEGRGTIAAARYQHVEGQYNIADTPDANGLGTYAHIVGNGNDDTRRSNAFTVNWAGHGWFKGGLDFTDSANGKRYCLTVRNGQLTLTEIS